MKRRSGFLYVMVLLITSLMLLLGMVYYASQGVDTRSTNEALDAAQAYQLARTGVDEARLKLAKDLNFPPAGGREQRTFSYAEQVSDANGPIGSYRVQVDSLRAGEPYRLYEIRCDGFVNPPGRPTAQATIRCWVSSEDQTVLRWDE